MREIVPYPIQLSWEGDDDVAATDGAADAAGDSNGSIAFQSGLGLGLLGQREPGNGFVVEKTRVCVSSYVRPRSRMKRRTNTGHTRRWCLSPMIRALAMIVCRRRRQAVMARGRGVDKSRGGGATLTNARRGLSWLSSRGSVRRVVPSHSRSVVWGTDRYLTLSVPALSFSTPLSSPCLFPPFFFTG